MIGVGTGRILLVVAFQGECRRSGYCRVCGRIIVAVNVVGSVVWLVLVGVAVAIAADRASDRWFVFYNLCDIECYVSS